MGAHRSHERLPERYDRRVCPAARAYAAHELVQAEAEFVAKQVSAPVIPSNLAHDREHASQIPCEIDIPACSKHLRVLVLARFEAEQLITARQLDRCLLRRCRRGKSTHNQYERQEISKQSRCMHIVLLTIRRRSCLGKTSLTFARDTARPDECTARRRHLHGGSSLSPVCEIRLSVG